MFLIDKSKQINKRNTANPKCDNTKTILNLNV